MEQQTTEKILEKLDQVIAMKEKLDQVIEMQEKMEKEQQEMKKEQQEMKEELTKVGNTVTRIEYEHGQKIDLILDVLTGHTEKLEEHDNRFKKDEKIVEMQGHRIYALEQREQRKQM